MVGHCCCPPSQSVGQVMKCWHRPCALCFQVKLPPRAFCWWRFLTAQFCMCSSSKWPWSCAAEVIFTEGMNTIELGENKSRFFSTRFSVSIQQLLIKSDIMWNYEHSHMMKKKVWLQENSHSSCNVFFVFFSEWSQISPWSRTHARPRSWSHVNCLFLLFSWWTEIFLVIQFFLTMYFSNNQLLLTGCRFLFEVGDNLAEESDIFFFPQHIYFSLNRQISYKNYTHFNI